MCVEVYVMNLKNFLSQPVNEYLHLFSAERREKILRQRFLADRNRTIWAELLVRNILSKKLFRPVEKISIVRDEFGKPFVLDSDLKISISHSKNWAAVSVGEIPCGIDVEEDFENGIDIAKNFFLTHEYKKIISDNENFGERFLMFWTLKESYFKLTGDESFLAADCAKLAKNENFVMENFFLPDKAVVGVCARVSRKIADDRYFTLKKVTDAEHTIIRSLLRKV